jgi:hypothetical protein
MIKEDCGVAYRVHLRLNQNGLATQQFIGIDVL